MNYYLLLDETTKGPYTIGQLRSMWNTGMITVNTPYCQQGDAAWKSLAEIQPQLEPGAVVSSFPGPVQPPSFARVQVSKSRGIYIILALFLGCLGIHNFYAGHYGKGTAQLVITLVLGWMVIGLIITGLWALSEIFAQSYDGEGVKMM